MQSALYLAVLSLLAGQTIAAKAPDWRSRSIYQVFTDRFARTDGSTTHPCDVKNNIYCGGTWKGIENKLDYIKNMGFTAIWISPITAQVDGAYHGYYQTDLYNVNSHFGTAADLKSLSTALHSRGMYLMVDVVPNHMGWAGCHDTVDYSHFSVLNSPSYYHTYCELNDMRNQTEVEQCWLGGNCDITMPDLNTTHPTVISSLQSWIRALVSNYTIDGLRIDSVKNVHPTFFPPFCAAAGVFCMGEVSEGLANYTYPYQQYMDSVLDYPLSYAITRVFQRKSNMADLVVNLAACTQDENAGCRDATLLGTFFENHDNARFASATKDVSLVRNALAFAVLSDGIPIVYQGQEQHFDGGDDPGCREAVWLSGFDTSAPLYRHVAYLNQIRNHVAAREGGYLGYWTRVLNYTEDTIQLRKDVIRTVLTNQGEKARSGTLKTKGMEFAKGAAVVDVLTCGKYTAGNDGEVDVKMEKGYPVVLVPEVTLKGSGMCGQS
ncbi:glycoside hydrolase family 13 protein [Aaosphaeria arxii CBS 175.79]|uniref:alpha-amylase n=1 Tax=Aaosphaeria arxii CBS 175.79 TaxID=1450172 RepID=A0A6A5Y4P2_9PLEO|nr:glycoside hydrolase family 13 protein [Aaosphaeria arxii CBS 175.79]KAF2020229.1 glycoside hydrolase family 13 protein [Aaosphaeria arxii CBS 175.79]